MILFVAFVFYIAVGFLIGSAFVICGVLQVLAMPVTLGARILLLPAPLFFGRSFCGVG